mmetsp:Transcript_38893/g.80759  ORF Transcript_38893/g.80759 Transcript_38893/m.80759 type:complete len:130 (-) Transcript_38893:2567-2956(-)
MIALDSSVGDPDCDVKDKEALIVGELEDFILEYDTELQLAFNTIADVDCILAFSSNALDRGYVRPLVVPASENCIEIRNGRHPLQEVVLENNFVPNDTVIDSTNLLNVITGRSKKSFTEICIIPKSTNC